MKKTIKDAKICMKENRIESLTMAVTYELCKNRDAKEYYQCTKRLAEQLWIQTEKIEEAALQFQDFVAGKHLEVPRKTIEYRIEILYFAVLHRWIQGVLNETTYDLSATTVPELIKSLSFMEESGEFKEETGRLKQWISFFQSNPEMDCKAFWQKTKELVETVDILGERHLKTYIPQLETYRERNRTAWGKREDAGLILRDKSCYYINMIAAQMLNRCYREEFLTCGKTYIFLPGCMAKRKNQCMADERKDGYVCRSCTEDCQVNRLSANYDNVRIVYHGSQMEKRRVDADEKIGVVGIACVLNLLAGGLKARRLGYIPQCVVLNECGCTIHWNEDGIVTSLEEEELREIVRL